MDGAAEQGDAADEAGASDGASQLIPGVRPTDANAMTRRRWFAVTSAMLLMSPSVLSAGDGGGSVRQRIWLGPGPFVLYSSCLAPQEGPAPSPLPFPRSVL